MSEPIILFSMLSIAAVLLLSSIVYFIYRWYTDGRDLPPDNIWNNFLDYSSDTPMLSEYNMI